MKTLLFIILLSIGVIVNAQISFDNENIIIKTETNHPNHISVADINGDGAMDLLSVSNFDSKVAWYKNLNNGSFGEQQIISISPGAVKAFAVDIDGDGDLDILSASHSYNHEVLEWYENLDGNGTFGSQNLIIDIFRVGETPIDIYPADIDGDGDLDVVFSTYKDNTIFWFENTDGNGVFNNQHTISTLATYTTALSVSDIDNDGDLDVISSLYNKIVLYKNIDGNGNFGSQQIITNEFSNSISIADIDNDGDMDVVSTSAGKVYWLENIDGNGTFDVFNLITDDADFAESVAASDINGDGALDVIVASRNKFTWYKNDDGLGNFGNQQIINYAYFGKSILASDIDGDGDMDIVAASYNDNKIAWYINTDGNGMFSNQQIISTSAYGIKSIIAVDIDGDGDMDIVSASQYDNKIAWYENTDGNGTFSIQKVISVVANRAASVFPADFDNDGDIDLVVAETYNNTVSWYENLNGNGSDWNRHIVMTYLDDVLSVSAADFDNDGFIDVVSANYSDRDIKWFRNNGDGTFQSQPIVAVLLESLINVYAFDMDNDGNIDIVSVQKGRIAWRKNNGNGSFGSLNTVSTEFDSYNVDVSIIDIDNDEDLDIVAMYHGNDKVVWYENLGNGFFSVQQLVGNTNYPYSVTTNDLDNDGDIDIIVTNEYDNNITWYENLNGNGTFSDKQTIISIEKPELVITSNIDNDGKVDIISTSKNDKITWNKNLGELLNIQQNQNLQFSVYPIPAKKQIQIKSKVAIKSISIYNNLGQIILSNSNKNNIDISSINKGVFFCKIEGLNGKIGVIKFIKE